MEHKTIHKICDYEHYKEIDALKEENTRIRDKNKRMSELLDRIKYAWYARYDDSIDEILAEWIDESDKGV